MFAQTFPFTGQKQIDVKKLVRLTVDKKDGFTRHYVLVDDVKKAPDKLGLDYPFGCTASILCEEDEILDYIKKVEAELFDMRKRVADIVKMWEK
jgi:hypothetical protein